MTSVLRCISLIATLILLAVTGCSPGRSTGVTLYREHCAGCHPDGGNTIRPDKTLHGKDLRANNIFSAADIVQKLRTPGTGMPRFSEAVIPDGDAYRIARYILETYP